MLLDRTIGWASLLVNTISWTLRLPRVTVWVSWSGRVSGHDPQLGRLGSLPQWGCRIGSRVGRSLWLGNLVRRGLEAMLNSRAVLLLGFLPGRVCRISSVATLGPWLGFLVRLGWGLCLAVGWGFCFAFLL